MKYLNNKNSRRRGIAMELAIMLLLVMAAVSTLLITTTMIHINKQKDSFSEIDKITEKIEKLEYDHIGKYFEKIVKEHVEGLNYPTLQFDVNNNYSTYEEIVKSEFETKIEDKYPVLVPRFSVSFKIESFESKSLEDVVTTTETKKTVISGKEYIYTVTYLLNIKKTDGSDAFNVEYVANFKQHHLNTKVFNLEKKIKDIINTDYYILESNSPNSKININLNPGYYIKFDNSLDFSKFEYSKNDNFIVNIDDKTITVKKDNIDYNNKKDELAITYNHDAETKVVIIIKIDSTKEAKKETTKPDVWDLQIDKKIDEEITIEEKGDPEDNWEFPVLQESKKINCTKWEYK